MASSDSEEDYSEEEDDSEYSDYDNDDDEDDEGASDESDEDEDGSDSEYSLDDEEEEEEGEDEDEDEEEGEEEGEEGDEVKEAALNAETEVGHDDNEEDEQEVPALEHAPREPDEISQHTDGPFSRQSTPDVSPNGLAVEKGTDSSLTDPAENAESRKKFMETPNVEDPPNNTKIKDPSDPASEVPLNATIDDRSAVER